MVGIGGRRCAAAGCGRFVGGGADWCRRHAERTGTGTEPEPEGFAPARIGERDASAFTEWLLHGEYRDLLGERYNELIRQAAEAPALVDEVGILRIVLSKVLLEEADPVRLAASVAKLIGVAVQVSRAQRTMSGETAGGLNAALTQILNELDGA